MMKQRILFRTYVSRSVIWIFVLLTLTVPLFAQNENMDYNLSLQDCIDYAMRYAPGIQAAFSQIDAQKERVQAAKADLWFPSITLNAMSSYKWQDMNFSAPDSEPAPEPEPPDPSDYQFLPGLDPYSDPITQAQALALLGMNSDLLFSGMDMSSMFDINQIRGDMVNSYEPFSAQVQLQISKPLFAGFALVNQVELEQVKLQSARLDLEKTRRDLEKRIIESFYGVLFLQEYVRVTQESLEVARESLDGMEQNYEQGLVDELTYLRFQINYEELVPQLLSAQNQLKTTKESLLILIGYQGVVEDPTKFEQVSLVGDFDDGELGMEYEEVVDAMLLNRTELRQLEEQKAQLEISQDLARSKFYPTISIFGNGAFTSSNHFADERAFYGFNVSGGIQIAFSLSDLIFPKNRTRSSIRAAKYGMEAITSQRQAMIDMFTIDIRNNLRTLQESRENLSVKKRVAQLTERTFELAKEQMNNGIITFLDFREIELQYKRAQLAVIQELYNYSKALLNLRYTMGDRLLPTD
jgi:outer membrane protein